MSAKQLANWRIPSGSFYPFSLYSVGNDEKTVFIVPGYGEVYTLVVKNVTENIRSGGSPHHVTNIKLEGAMDLVQIVELAEHTVGLGGSGQLMVFSSARECKVLGGSYGVRAICAMEGGSKLVLMRLLDEDRLQMDVVGDVEGPQIGASLKTFDLSWDKSGFPISRKQQCCTIGTVMVRPEDLKFFQRFLNCNDLTEGTELILFTLDNGLYWIKLDGDSYEVVAVKLFPVNIKDFNFACSTSCFSTLLESNVLNVCSISVQPEHLLIQESNICLGHSVDAHKFVSDLSFLIFSNGSEIIQLKYYFSELSKTIENETKEFPIAGVTALTYHCHDKQVISITENRLIYSIPISPHNERTNFKNNKYFELTDEVLSQAKQMTCLLTNEAELNRKIIKQVAEEKTKIEILSSVSNQSYFKNFIEAQMLFQRTLPVLSSDVILLEKISVVTGLIAELKVTFKNDFHRILNQQKQWMLSVSIDSKVYHIQMDATNLDDNSTKLIIPISEQYFTLKGLPTVNVSLLHLINHSQDCLSLHIPIKLKSNYSFANLLEFGRTLPLNGHPIKDLRDQIRSLINRNEKRPLSTSQIIEYRLKLEASIGNLARFLTLVGITVPMGNDSDPIEKINVCLGSAEAEVRWNATGGDDLWMKSSSPGILMVLKMLCSTVRAKDSASVDKMKAIQLRLMQSEQGSEGVVSLYRTLRTSSSNT